MVDSLPAVVIDNGTHTTRAGFSLEDIPSLVFNTNYALDPEGKPIVGDSELALHPELDVMTLMDNGLVYNFDHIASNWQYVYDHLDAGAPAAAAEHPLMVTEEVWNTAKNKAASAQIAFETFGVPLFSLVKTPLAQLYHMGRLSGLVVDVGAGTASVTPILDGIIQLKSCFHSRYAGDFALLHALRLLEAKLGYGPEQLDYARLMPRKYTAASDSFRRYYVAHNLLHNFKQTMVHVSEPPPGMPANAYYLQQHHQHPTHYQVADGTHVPYLAHDIVPLGEPLFAPHAYKLPGVPVPEPAYDKASTHGISNLVLFTVKNLETAFMLSITNENQSSTANARFNEILRQLFSNTLITGGGALMPGLADRICGDLGRTAPQVLPNYHVTASYKLFISPLRNHATGDINDTFDKKFGSWLGAANLAGMLKENIEDGSANIALDNWFVSKADYEELGEDLIMEKFK